MGFKNWETPPDFFRRLDEEFHFTLDAAASHENALCDCYLTTEGCFRKDVEAPRKLTSQDGLTHGWSNERAFCNPPYDSSIGQWVDKALRREAEVAVLLLPPSVDTAWFHRLHAELKLNAQPDTIQYGGKLWRGDTAPGLSLLFMEGRLRFYRAGKPGDAPRAGNLLVVVRR